jgi:uncharacterized protein YjbI with pentapeptide repeats
LRQANLQRASLESGKLQNAFLGAIDLRGASLVGANLQDATLWVADLRGANFTGANLFRADMQRAKLNAETILPDGSHYDPDKGLEQLDPFIKGQWYQETESEWAKWNR